LNPPAGTLLRAGSFDCHCLLFLLGHLPINDWYLEGSGLNFAFIPGRKRHGNLDLAVLCRCVGDPDRAPKTAASLSPMDQSHPDLHRFGFWIMIGEFDVPARANLVYAKCPPGPHKRLAFILQAIGADEDIEGRNIARCVADPLALLDDAAFSQRA